MRFGVGLGRLAGMVLGLDLVAMGEVGVMAGGFVIALLVVLGRFAMMPGSMLVMLGGLLVVLVRGFFRHGFPLCVTDAFRPAQTARLQMTATCAHR